MTGRQRGSARRRSFSGPPHTDRFAAGSHATPESETRCIAVECDKPPRPIRTNGKRPIGTNLQSRVCSALGETETDSLPAVCDDRCAREQYGPNSAITIRQRADLAAALSIESVPMGRYRALLGVLLLTSSSRISFGDN